MRKANTITPGSAFDPAWKSDVDWSKFGPMKNGLTKRQTATKQRVSSSKQPCEAA